MGEYHIAWFDADHAEQAVSLLEKLPADELRTRGKKYSSRMWENVPAPNLDGTVDRARQMHCMATDFRGSAMLMPGGLVNSQVLYVFDFCEKLTEIEPGLIASRIKPETWALPPFVKEAAAVKKNEAETVLRIQALNEARRLDAQEKRKQTLRRFLVAVGNQCIMGGKNPDELSDDALTDVYTLNELAGVKLPSPDAWMQLHGVDEVGEKAEEPYSAEAELAHHQNVANAEGLTKRRFEVTIGPDGKPIQGSKRRIA